jgi:hypothetical protein
VLFGCRTRSKEVPAKRRVGMSVPSFPAPTLASADLVRGRGQRGERRREHVRVQQQAHVRRAYGACRGEQGRDSGVQHGKCGGQLVFLSE